jgi:hypothetical protein
MAPFTVPFKIKSSQWNKWFGVVFFINTAHFFPVWAGHP